MDPTYTIYKQHDETMVHVLCECPLARNVWAMVRGRLQKCNSKASNFYTLARQMEEKATKKGIGDMDDSVVGYLECKKSVPL